MDHYYKYEGMSEEDRNGLIPFMHVSEALKIDPEDSGREDEPKPNKALTQRHPEPAKGYVRKTRDQYTMLADIGDGLGMRDAGVTRDNWPDMREALEHKRKAYPETRYSYRKRRIKLQ